MSEAGEILAGKYELIAPIGQGGMASVWRARTLGAAGFSRKVAVKRLLSTLSKSPGFAAMFVEEARVVAELQHPNIVQVHDFDKDGDENYFIVLEWVEGIDLSQYVRAHESLGLRTTWHIVAAIGIEILRALRAAHGRVDDDGRAVPVIHRDVNPANILLGVNGIVKLADFGLARAMDRNSMTDPGVAKGKVSYLSPELALGRPASPLSDLYGVGIVLWEALTQKRLFYGRSLVDTALMVRDGNVPPLADERNDLPEALCEVVHTALARDPKDRFDNAGEMLHALTAILRSHPEPTDTTHLAWSVRRAMGLKR
jgi:eukaryotic-like serine/threonine-protein kinase